jgi:Lrp/AsnC family transcriptional regulator, leucine-responsive regulatory protein
MEDEGIIQNYWTQIDSYKLGYSVYRYYIVLQNATPDVKNKIINHIVNYKNTWVVGTIKGMYDLTVVIWVKSTTDFYSYWDKTNDLYGDYFAEKIFSVYLQAYCYPMSFLLLDEYEKSSRDDHELITGGGNVTDIDKVDYLLLNELAENARISLIDLAKKLKCSSQMVDYRIKNLRKKDVIQAFRVNIDVSKLGYEHFKLDIYLKEPSQRKKIFEFFKYNKYVPFINTSAGYADIEVELIIENSDNMIALMDEVYTKFPEVIKKYTYFTVQKSYKLRCLPEMTNVDFKS